MRNKAPYFGGSGVGIGFTPSAASGRLGLFSIGLWFSMAGAGALGGGASTGAAGGLDLTLGGVSRMTGLVSLGGGGTTGAFALGGGVIIGKG